MALSSVKLLFWLCFLPKCTLLHLRTRSCLTFPWTTASDAPIVPEYIYEVFCSICVLEFDMCSRGAFTALLQDVGEAHSAIFQTGFRSESARQ